MKTRTLVVLLDADGCFYNKKFQYLLLYTIRHHGDFIKDLLVNHYGVEVSVERQAEYKNTFESIQREIREITISDVDCELFLNDLKNQFTSRKKNLTASESDKLIADLCSEYISYLDEVNREFLDDMVCHANENLIEKIKLRAEQQHIKKIIFMVGSNRQSMKTDLYNMHRNGTRSFFQDLNMFVKFMEKTFSPNNIAVSLDKFLMSDIHSNLPPGESYNRILRELNSCQASVQSTSIFDVTKVSIIYGFLHYLAMTYKDEYESGQLMIDYYDDVPDILGTISKIYNQKINLGLLPNNLLLTLYHYVGDKIEDKNKVTVNGNGKVDPTFRNSVKEMFALCDRPDPGEKVNVATHMNFSKFRKLRNDSNAKVEVSVSLSGVGLFSPGLEKTEKTSVDEMCAHIALPHSSS